MKAPRGWSQHWAHSCSLALLLCATVKIPFVAAQSGDQQPPANQPQLQQLNPDQLNPNQLNPDQLQTAQTLPGQLSAEQPLPVPEQVPVPASWMQRWKNLLQSDRQRLQQQKDAGHFEELASATGDAQWSAAGRFREGDFAGAAEDYAQFGDEQALYNGATAMAHAADYDSSLKLFDELLQRNPQHEDALHNRSVVEKLRDMQQQQEEQQQQNGEGSDDQNSDQQQDPQDSDSPQDQSEQDQSGQQEQQQGDPQEQDEQQAQASSSPPEEIDEQQLQQSEEERQALERAIEEAQRELQQQALREQPMTEAEQATEQWLRQIPDDPSGLLRRKLQRSHATDYPRIGDSKKPW